MSITDGLLHEAFKNIPDPHWKRITDTSTGVPIDVFCLSDAVSDEYDRLHRLAKFDMDRLRRVVERAARPHLWK
jgi:hypothetical protein